MSRISPMKLNGHARPIKTERDFKGAVSVVRTIVNQPDRETTAEKRLQSLIREMEKFDDAVDDDMPSIPEEDSHGGPKRRWSDDNSDPE